MYMTRSWHFQHGMYIQGLIGERVSGEAPFALRDSRYSLWPVQRDLRHESCLHAFLPRDDHNACFLLVGVGPAGSL